MALDERSKSVADKYSKYERSVPRNVPRQNNGGSFSEKLADNPIINTILGLGDPSRRAITEAVNLLPGVDLDYRPSGSGTAYNVSKFAGEAIPLMAALSPVGRSLKSLGLSGRLLPTMAGEGMATGLYESLINPESRIKSGLVGAGVGAAASPVLKGISSVASYAEPIGRTILEKIPFYKAVRQKKAEDLSEELFKVLAGGKSPSEAREAAKMDVSQSQASVENKARDLYEMALKEEGNDRVFGQLDQIAGFNEGNKDLLPKTILEGSSYKKAVENPTKRNLHEFQSDIAKQGYRILKSAKPGTTEEDKARLLIEASKRVKDNLINNLSAPAREKYLEASNFYRKNVRPFYETKNIQKFIGTENVGDETIKNLFAYPGEGKGEGLDWRMNSILKNLSRPDFDENLLKWKLGEPGNMTPEDLVSKSIEMNPKYGSYMPQSFKERVAEIERFLPHRGTAQSAAETFGLKNKEVSRIPDSVKEILKKALIAKMAGGEG